jgi:hypothetical protein
MTQSGLSEFCYAAICALNNRSGLSDKLVTWMVGHLQYAYTMPLTYVAWSLSKMGWIDDY